MHDELPAAREAGRGGRGGGVAASPALPAPLHTVQLPQLQHKSLNTGILGKGRPNLLTEFLFLEGLEVLVAWLGAESVSRRDERLRQFLLAGEQRLLPPQ